MTIPPRTAGRTVWVTCPATLDLGFKETGLLAITHLVVMGPNAILAKAAACGAELVPGFRIEKNSVVCLACLDIQKRRREP